MYTFNLSLCAKLKLKHLNSINKDLGNNLIINGDFEYNQEVNYPTTFDSILGWTSGSDKIELGQGRNYNINWPKDNIVAKLNTNKNSYIQQSVMLSGNVNCLLKFKYAYATNNKASTIIVSINDNVIFSASEYNTIINFATIPVKGYKDNNIIKFQGSGLDDGLGISVDDIGFYCEEVIVMGPDKCNKETEYIQNGSFNQLNIEDNYIDENASFNEYNSYNNIPGWFSYKENNKLKIVAGNTVNNNLNESLVAIVNSNKNNYITQKFLLFDNMTCLLRFKYASNILSNVDTLNVKFNDNIVFDYIPKDILLREAYVEVAGIIGENKISFIVEGSNDSKGFIIDDVSIKCDCNNNSFLSSLIKSC